MSVPATPIRCAPRRIQSRWMTDITLSPCSSWSGSTIHMPVSSQGLSEIGESQVTRAHGNSNFPSLNLKNKSTRTACSPRNPESYGSFSKKAQSKCAGPLRQDDPLQRGHLGHDKRRQQKGTYRSLAVVLDSYPMGQTWDQRNRSKTDWIRSVGSDLGAVGYQENERDL